MKTETLKDIKEYLLILQELILKSDYSDGQQVKIRCNISEINNEISKKIGHCDDVLKYEIGNKYVGLRIAQLQQFQNMSPLEIVDFISTSLYTVLGMPCYILDPITIGIEYLKQKINDLKP